MPKSKSARSEGKGSVEGSPNGSQLHGTQPGASSLRGQHGQPSKSEMQANSSGAALRSKDTSPDRSAVKKAFDKAYTEKVKLNESQELDYKEEVWGHVTSNFALGALSAVLETTTAKDPEWQKQAEHVRALITEIERSSNFVMSDEHRKALQEYGDNRKLAFICGSEVSTEQKMALLEIVIQEGLQALQALANGVKTSKTIPKQVAAELKDELRSLASRVQVIMRP